ncbi:MAG TPA: hypothetical protein VFA81_11900 [Burkholderiales bacterium]|nr:hypothetical protein [Burkholderiales bacterium]
MKIGELTPSKYLKKDDFPAPALLTIKEVKKENVALPNQPKKERGVVYFEERDKGMVFNTTNLKRTEKALGSDDTDKWIGKKIVVFYDENVEFGGEMVGGLRVRAQKATAAPAKDAEPVAGGGRFDDMDDDLPF